MSAEEPRLREATCQPLMFNRPDPWLQHPDARELINGEEKCGCETPSTPGSSETSDESEPESPPPIVRRKVSFADAFGLNLVSVKEFSKEASEAQVEQLFFGLETDEHYLSSLFSPPSTPEELLKQLKEKNITLEAIELLPGTTTLRGTVRVANLCFQKSVFVRTTYDCWASHFDILAEYIPGSSDKDSDGFSFRLTLVPPFEPEGVRIEFCLRYETPAGQYWDNNNGINYSLYCRKRDLLQQEKKEEKKEKPVKSKIKCKRSCLKHASKIICPESSQVESAAEVSESVTHKAAAAARITLDNTENYASEASLQKTLVDSRRNRRRARLAQVKEHFAKKVLEHLTDGEKSPESSHDPIVTPSSWIDAVTKAELLKNECANAGEDKTPMYHEIPLTSLSWDRNSGPKHLSDDLLTQGSSQSTLQERQDESMQNELDKVTRPRLETHQEGGKHSNAFEELGCPSPPSTSEVQPLVSQSELAVTHMALRESIPVALANPDTGSQNPPWLAARLHVTKEFSSTDLEMTQECSRRKIDDPAPDARGGKPLHNGAKERPEVNAETRVAGTSTPSVIPTTAVEVQALGEPQVQEHLSAIDDQAAECKRSGEQQMPRGEESDNTGRGGESSVTASEKSIEELTTSEWASPSSTHDREKTIPSQEKSFPLSALSPLHTSFEHLKGTETTEAEPVEFLNVLLDEGRRMAKPELAGLIPEHAIDTRAQQTLKPEGSTENSGTGERLSADARVHEDMESGGSELSVNTKAKVMGGESQDCILCPSSGNDTVTFTDTSGTAEREHAHLRGQEEDRQKERENEVAKEEKGDGEEEKGRERENPLKILNEGEHKEQGEGKEDTIQESNRVLSREMSHFTMATRQDASEVLETSAAETERLDCQALKVKKEKYVSEECKEDMKECLGLETEQPNVNELALCEQLNRASKGNDEERERRFVSEMLAEGLEEMQEPMCLARDTTGAVESGEDHVTVATSNEEFRDRGPQAQGEGVSSEGVPVTPIITLVEQELVRAPRPSIPIPLHPICSLQATVSGYDSSAFHAEECTPICPVQAMTWSTCATISAPLGDSHEIGVVLRHRLAPQPGELHQIAPEEGEPLGQRPSGGTPGHGTEPVDSAPMFWVRELGSLSPVLRAMVYIVLFVMFCLTAFVCDLPFFLAIYLFSICWWCCHGEIQPLPHEKEVD